MRLCPIEAEVDCRCGRVAMLLHPPARKLPLEDLGAEINAAIAKEPFVLEYLPDVPPIGQTDQRRADVGRSFIEETVEVLILAPGIGEQERQAIGAVPFHHAPSCRP